MTFKLVERQGAHKRMTLRKVVCMKKHAGSLEARLVLPQSSDDDVCDSMYPLVLRNQAMNCYNLQQTPRPVTASAYMIILVLFTGANHLNH